MTDDPVTAIAGVVLHTGLRVAVAESLTAGKLSARLGAGPDASTWFRGGLVAYAPDAKVDLLDVTPGPVVTELCAREMARGVAHLLKAEATVAATGVGGPDPEEGMEPGTVYVAARVRGHERCRRLAVAGGPQRVLEETTVCALDLLLELLKEAAAPATPHGVTA